MEGKDSRSLSELAECAGEEKSLLENKEGEKLAGVTSLDTLVPEEEVEAPLSVNQVLTFGSRFSCFRGTFCPGRFALT